MKRRRPSIHTRNVRTRYGRRPRLINPHISKRNKIRAHSISDRRSQLARDFFTKRFNRSPEDDPLYFKEWQERINTYTPSFLEGTADSESMRVLKEVKKKYPDIHVPGLKNNGG